MNDNVQDKILFFFITLKTGLLDLAKLEVDGGFERSSWFTELLSLSRVVTAVYELYLNR